MVQRVSTVAFEGIEARSVDVQVQVAPGLPAFAIVGLPDKAVSEARERVRSALIASGLALPARRITVNLAPADLPKEGSHYDLPIALGLMAAIGAIGLAISTFTEHAIGAIAAVMILVVASEVVDNIPQFATVAPYLPTHWWNSFDALLRTPVDTSTLEHGLLSFVVYAALFFLIAWARFTSSDVTS